MDLAHGAGQGSTITGKGAQFVAGKNLTLQAEGNIYLQAWPVLGHALWQDIGIGHQ
ncbi:hypothetical protein [Chromobacterium amazonense]|uniref:hypothetical protein n=1 Tax=Chromobacterium amazonense TaxID=1382803 RepID=UPI0031F6D77F